jgi:2-phosphosulfolactate phosphatase
MTAGGSLTVHPRPDLIPPGALQGGVAVVIDVLRATTVMIETLASGCPEIRPCGEIEEARRLAASLPPGSALLAGERQGLPIAGFDLGNSPGEFTPGVCRDKTVVMTTTNGTRAILAALDADRVLIAAFVNQAAVVQALRAESRPIHLLCAGTEGQVSLEDTLMAGSLIEQLTDHASVAADDVSQLANLAWRGCQAAVPPNVDTQPGGRDRHLAGWLVQGRGGRRLAEIGLTVDIASASRIDHHGQVLAEVLTDPLRIVRVHPD